METLFSHVTGVKPAPGSIELGRGADRDCLRGPRSSRAGGQGHEPPLQAGAESRRPGTAHPACRHRGDRRSGRQTRVFNHGTDSQERSWLVRERVFDVFPRGSQAARRTLIDLILKIHPNADVSILMLPDPTFDNVRWGYTQVNREPRWILIDP